MSHYKPYPAYKDSGVAWLGEVPAHWQVKRLRYAATLNPPVRTGLTPDSEVSFLPMDAIGTDGSINLEETRPVAEVRNGYSYFEDGDVTFAKVTPCFENGKGAVMCGLSGGVGFGTTELTVLRPNDGTDLHYIGYQLKSDRFRLFGAGAMTGAGGLKRVPDEFTRNFLVPWPEFNEQQAIATRLDRETSRIDGLIRKKTRFIDLLHEKRQSLINHVVTKGLDPDAKMKDSGVEWLGFVPEHWNVKKLMQIAKIVRGASPRPAGDPKYFDKENEDGSNTPWVTVGEVTNVSGDYVSATNTYLTPLGVSQSQRFNRGTLVFSNSGATLGVPKILAINCCANDGVLAFTSLSPLVDIRFLCYFLATTTSRLREEMQKGGQPNLNTDIVKGMVFPATTMVEQVAIVTFLDMETASIDALLCKTQRSIALLKERRSALITAAVTGQIDLREAA